MRTGAIFARGSCRALRWMALFGVVFALGAGEALAQTGTYDLTASDKLTEGQSLVPISVTFSIPAEVPQNDRAGTVAVTVSVRQPSLARIRATQRVTTMEELHSAIPPVTRAELTTGEPAGELVGQTVLFGTDTDVSWAGRTEGNVTTDPNGTAVFSFTYSEAAATITHTAYLRTNRDSADAEDELFELTLLNLSANNGTDAVTVAPGDTTAIPVARATGDRDVVVKIDDAQDQTYVINFPGDNDRTIDEGTAANLEFEAVPDRTVHLPFNVTLSSLEEAADYSLDIDPAAISQNYRLDVRRLAKITWRLLEIGAILESSTGEVGRW